MNESKRQALKARLLQLRAETRSAGPAKIEPNRRDPTTVGTADEDEQALSEMLQTLASQRNRKQAELIALVDRALAKMASSPDEVGLCEECDEEIAQPRLELMPYTTLCAECQAAKDPRRGQGRKSITDYK
jgi:DnaK suppressor protein